MGTLGTQGPGSPPCLWPGGCRVDALGRSWLGKDQAPPLPPQVGLGWWLGGGWQRRTPSGLAQGRPALSSGHSPGQQGAPWGLRHGRLETEKQVESTEPADVCAASGRSEPWLQAQLPVAPRGTGPPEGNFPHIKWKRREHIRMRHVASICVCGPSPSAGHLWPTREGTSQG